jgi:predicted deacetylase
MSAKYLVRFDDICPTMNWDIWERIEAILLEFDISPILAVVPDNRDPKLVLAEARNDFWGKVREWQARGWTIGLHGYQHLYANESAGLLEFPEGSEFAGIPGEEQEKKLLSAIEVFRKESVTPEVWIAPAHSFDGATLSALKRVGLSVISDGFALSPHTRDGMFWVPQQLWRFRWRPFGVWTVCCHHNGWSESDLTDFERAVRENYGAITSLKIVKEAYQRRSRHLFDDLYSRLHTGLLLIKRRVRLANDFTNA